jgi:hypothetical protein
LRGVGGLPLVGAEHEVSHPIEDGGVADGAEQLEVALVAVDDERPSGKRDVTRPSLVKVDSPSTSCYRFSAEPAAGIDPAWER